MKFKFRATLMAVLQRLWGLKFKFRATLLTILLGLLVSVVIILGVTSFWNAHQNAKDLGRQILAQLSLRISDQSRHHLRGAEGQVRLDRKAFETGRVKPEDFPALVSNWKEVMAVRPGISRLSVGLPTGEWLYVRRTASTRIAVGELRRNQTTSKLELANYWADEYPGERFYFHPDQEVEDPRRRPWYLKAVEAGEIVWTESYVLFGVRGVEETPGISCAGPAFATNGKPLAVVEASIDLYRLCDDLKEMPVATNGYAFIVELRKDGTRRVIGHPDANVILHQLQESGDVRVSALVPPEKCSDQRVRDFMAQLPADLPGQGSIESVRFESDGEEYLGGFRHVTSHEGPDALICMMVPIQDIMASVYRHNWITLGLGVSALLLAVLSSMWVTRQVSHPIELIVRETEQIGEFHVEAGPVIGSRVVEVDRLARATEQMKTSLRSFRKFVPANLVRRLLASGVEARLGGEEREVTIFFCDVANFTTISEGLTPQALVEQLGEYFRAFTEEVVASGGTVDKYIGDAVMAFWGAPDEMSDHAAAACKAALACQKRLAELRESWRAAGKPEMHARIGINTGTVVVGNIGSEQRLNFTVIGDPVNVASRLEGLNKFFGTAILLSESTYQAAAHSIVVRPIDWVSVKGKKEGGLVYELLGLPGQISTDRNGSVERYRQALSAYRERDWDKAVALFQAVATSCPCDRASGELLQRCRRFQISPPPPDWDGVFHMESK